MRTLKIIKPTTVILLIIMITLYIKVSKVKFYDMQLVSETDGEFEDFKHGKWRNLNKEQIQQLSNLGRTLFLQEEPRVLTNRSTPFKILLWKHGARLDKRHIYQYTNKERDPFQYCSVKNCDFMYKDADIATADVVIFHLHLTKALSDLPLQNRSTTQIWTFLTDESPYHTFLYSRNNSLPNYNDIFNWSMTYKMNSDVPVPYGRTEPLDYENNKFNISEWNDRKKQDVLVAVLISNCAGKNNRIKYIEELRKHINVDYYGRCGNLKCPGHFQNDCINISAYKFYLAFENSNCEEYITEKVWWNAYHKEAIPVVMGGTKSSYQMLLPPNSFIHVEDFNSPIHLAKYITYLNKTNNLTQYFEWKRYFRVLNEHGYFNSLSVHYCRICEALNYNSKETKVYHNLRDFTNVNQCHKGY